MRAARILSAAGPSQRAKVPMGGSVVHEVLSKSDEVTSVGAL